MSEACIFCKINKGEIPSFKIYEDEYFNVILDRYPAAKGHLLVIAKAHCTDVLNLPEETAQKLYPLVKVLAKDLKNILGAEGINIVQNNGLAAGQTIDHFHLHLIPRYTGDGVILNQTTHQETTLEELEQIAKQLSK